MKDKITPQQARDMLWEQGVLHWILKPVQLDLYNAYLNCNEKIVVYNCARRLGKSFTLCVIALEVCMKTKHSHVKYCCSKQKEAKNIIRPLIREILETCPQELKPIYKTQEQCWVFPNGSRIELTGLDCGRAESIRGGGAHLAIIDEAGLVNDLVYIITSILLPTTTTTKGKIILSSTPPKSPAHPFVTKYLNKARLEGNLITKTIYDNPFIDKQEFEKLVEECGGVDSVDFRREYKAEIIKDENYDIFPEFTSELKERIVLDWPRSPFYDGYVAMDVGMKDLTVVLFAWYDFKESKLIIEDEFVINGMKFNTSTLATGIKQKEANIFTDKITGEQKEPYVRVSDNNLIVIKDLFDLHGMRFMPTRKDDADAALNKVRIMLQNEQIIINPRCTTLIHHLEAGVWNKNKSSFERSADNGHYDACDSLKYLVRNIQTNKNPYPSGYFHKYSDDAFKYNAPAHPQAAQFNKLMNMTKPSERKQQLVKILNFHKK